MRALPDGSAGAAGARPAEGRGALRHGLQGHAGQGARSFSNEVGNPFSRIALDESGSAGIEWGVYGVPETFVIDGKGIVRLRHAGPLTPGVIANDILPAIAKARARLIFRLWKP